MTVLLHRTTDPGLLSSVRRDKSIRTTIPAKDGKRVDDLLDRDFTAAAPNRV